MKDLIINNHVEYRYPEDVERIVKILAERGYRATNHQANQVWDMYSESMCAGWMILPENDEEVFDCIRLYIEN